MQQLITTLLCLCLCTVCFAQRKHVAGDKMHFLIEDASYKESKDGAIIPKLRMGAKPYKYRWTGPDGFTSCDSALYNLKAGVYTVLVYDAGCGKLTDTLEVRSVREVTGISKTFRIASVKPNPFIDIVELSIRSTQEQQIHIDVFRSNGMLFTSTTSLVYEGETKIQLDLKEAPAGIYILNLCNNENCKLTERVIKVE